ncbi:hypothetical protein ADUPG1_008006 [Aduncisulcus paluster]|uniref:Uncharacterized protein n=1 Tax=Aduncisulcus paluster TaxID=2918883 RepID=A0ABQ5KQD8_9EUKA|nr:hypothetical protein ADUPG1_008006 [Aduncisulcus paluster]
MAQLIRLRDQYTSMSVSLMPSVLTSPYGISSLQHVPDLTDEDLEEIKERQKKRKERMKKKREKNEQMRQKKKKIIEMRKKKKIEIEKENERIAELEAKERQKKNQRALQERRLEQQKVEKERQLIRLRKKEEKRKQEAAERIQREIERKQVLERRALKIEEKKRAEQRKSALKRVQQLVAGAESSSVDASESLSSSDDSDKDVDSSPLVKSSKDLLISSSSIRGILHDDSSHAVLSIIPSKTRLASSSMPFSDSTDDDTSNSHSTVDDSGVDHSHFDILGESFSEDVDKIFESESEQSKDDSQTSEFHLKPTSTSQLERRGIGEASKSNTPSPDALGKMSLASSVDEDGQSSDSESSSHKKFMNATSSSILSIELEFGDLDKELSDSVDEIFKDSSSDILSDL